MKKWLIRLTALVVLLLAGSYVFVPGKLTIAAVTLINATSKGTYRCLSEKNKWPKWWPDSDSKQHSSTGNKEDLFVYNGSTYQISQQLFNTIEVLIQNNNYKINSFLYVIPLRADSVAIEWKGFLQTSLNPLTRMRQYLQARDLKNDMTTILARLKPFLEKKENIYNITIEETTVKDTLLVASKAVTTGYPATSDVYDLIKKLKAYIRIQGASETNYPMLHVKPIDSTHFEAMVAIPVNKELKNTKNIFFKTMVAGNILVTEVTGGPHRISQAYAQLENYMEDYQKVPPAIPFESLVTDRLQQTDTTKWVTRIYYPVF